LKENKTNNPLPEKEETSEKGFFTDDNGNYLSTIDGQDY